MSAPAATTRVRQWLPILEWLPDYRPAWLRGDLIAAVTSWALIVPQAIAYAEIAGLPPQAGLAAAAAGLFGYALLGTSKQLLVSPTSSTAAISFALVGTIAAGDAARIGALSAALAILVGIVFVVLGLAKIGFIARFIPTAVQVGFMFGLGLTILVGQLPKILGIPGVHGSFTEEATQIAQGLGEIDVPTLVLGILALVALILGHRYAPTLPMALIVVAAGIVAVATLGLEARGVEVIGAVSGGLPIPAVPLIGAHDLLALVPGAIAIAVIGSAESLTVAQQFADEHRDEIRPDQELVANGGANLLAGLFQGFIVGGGASQSAANDRAGATTPLASLIVAGLTVVTMVALLPLFHDLPQAVLGAIVISAVIGFLRIDELARIRRLRPEGFVMAIVALVATLLLGILPGLIVAVVLSLLLLLVRLARPTATPIGRRPGGTWASMTAWPDARAVPGLIVLRLDAPLLFLNAALLRDEVRGAIRAADEPPDIVLVELEASSDLDVEGLDIVVRLADQVREAGAELWLAEIRPNVRAMFERAGVESETGSPAGSGPSARRSRHSRHAEAMREPDRGGHPGVPRRSLRLGDVRADASMTAFFSSLAGYRPDWLRSDLVAGLTVWAVLVPEALAYATIAGVPPVIGLYAAPGALLLYAAFGSSRHLVAGPMAATAALSAAVVADHATAGTEGFIAFTVALALVVGAIAIIAGLLRLGFLASFISEPVLKGFIIGLALTIIAGQLPKLFGIDKVEGDFFEEVVGFVGGLGTTSIPTLVIGLLSLAIVVGLKEFAPVVPGSLVAVGFGIGAVALLHLDEQGVDIVGPIQGGLPAFGVPDVGGIDYLRLGPAAVGVALVGFVEGLGAAKIYAARNHYDIDANRELVGLGAANFASGFSGGMVVNGSLSKTAVNAGAGARTQLSGLVVAALTLVTLLFLTGLFEQLPEATLAAIVIAALIELVDIRSLVGFYGVYTSRLGRIYGFAARPDFIAAVATTLGVLLFDTLPGLFIGVLVSIILLVYRASRPHVASLGLASGTTDQYSDIERHPDNSIPTGITILRPESSLFFANADRIRDAIRSAALAEGIHTVILDLETVPDVDLTAAKMLVETREDLAGRGVALVYARDVGQVRDVLRTQDADAARVYQSVAAAVAVVRSPPPGTPGRTP